MELLKKFRNKIAQINFIDELSKNAWIFFSSLSLIFEVISKWLVNYLQINTLDIWNWHFLDEATIYFIEIPIIIYLFGYVIMRLIKINTDKVLTTIHLFLFIISLFLFKIYIINFKFIIIFILITFLIFICNIYKSISINQNESE